MSLKVALVLALVALLCLCQKGYGATTAVPRRPIRDFAQSRLCALSPQLCRNNSNQVVGPTDNYNNNDQNTDEEEKEEDEEGEMPDGLQEGEENDNEENSIVEGEHADEVDARARRQVSRRRGSPSGKRRGRRGRKTRCKGKKCGGRGRKGRKGKKGRRGRKGKRKGRRGGRVRATKIKKTKKIRRRTG